MVNETQCEVWGAADDWSKAEPISDYGTPLLMEALNLQLGERVLDVGCGGAKTTVVAARAVGPSGHATGVDIAQVMIELAKMRRDESELDNVDLAVCDVQTDTFPSGPFDATLSQFGIMFFDEPIAALQNVARQMNPGGRVAFTVWRDQQMAHNPGPIIARHQMPDIETSDRAGSWADAAYATKVLTTAGFKDVRLVEHTIKAEVPPDTDVPVSTWIDSVHEEYRDAVLADWREHLSSLIVDGVMRFELRMCLVTAQLPS